MSVADVLPVLFLSHGGGPCWFLDGSRPESSWAKEFDVNSASADFMRSLRSIAGLPRSPDAILVVSAHWEEENFAVLTAARPSLYFDYYGFPDHTYHLKWSVPGAPKFAERTKELLNKAGFQCTTDPNRGLDHGVFVPLMLAYPEGDVPVFQLSLKKGLDIEEHLRLGEALNQLRSENVLLVGSGQSTHNLNEISRGGSCQVPPWCLRFRDWFHDVLTNTSYAAEDRKNRLLASTEEPTFHKAHPRIEHFLPSAVMSAVAGYKPGKVLFEQFVGGTMLMSTVVFE